VDPRLIDETNTDGPSPRKVNLVDQ
jgi:hypothetical protein